MFREIYPYKEIYTLKNADGGQLSLKEMMSNGEKAGTVHVKQADLAPFMATLLGANIPVNSVGLLPHRLLDMHPLDVVKALKVGGGVYSSVFSHKIGKY